jgi:hypothetical protein
MRRFAIAFSGRAGSSFLEGLLDSHPDVRCYGEIFADHPAARTLSEEETRTRLDEMIHQEPGVAACGFKLPFCTVAQPPRMTDILMDGGYRIIHLTRRNKLEQVVSYFLATTNTAWRSDFGSYTTDRASLDPDFVLDQIAELTAFDSATREMIAGFPVLPICYEDIVTEEALPAVLGFLGLPPAALTSRYERQRRLPIRDTLLNYDAVALALESRGLGHFLE